MFVQLLTEHSSWHSWDIFSGALTRSSAGALSVCSLCEDDQRNKSMKINPVLHVLKKTIYFFHVTLLAWLQIFNY